MLLNRPFKPSFSTVATVFKHDISSINRNSLIDVYDELVDFDRQVMIRGAGNIYLPALEISERTLANGVTKTRSS